MKVYTTVTQIKAANRAAGQHFFDPDTMRFFRSRMLRGVIGGRFFITSEQYVDSEGNADPRRYTVRVVDDAGHVDTVGEFQAYATPAAARAAARKLADQ